MVHSFFFITSFSCLYLDNNCPTLFFVVCPAKSLLCFMIDQVLFAKLLSAYLGKSKRKVLSSAVVLSSIYSMCAPLILVTWLSYCKLFWWFYWVDKVDTIFVWFWFLVCINYFQLLFVLIILDVWLIVCLDLKFWFLFLFCFVFFNGFISPFQQLFI